MAFPIVEHDFSFCRRFTSTRLDLTFSSAPRPRICIRLFSRFPPFPIPPQRSGAHTSLPFSSPNSLPSGISLVTMAVESSAFLARQVGRLNGLLNDWSARARLSFLSISLMPSSLCLHWLITLLSPVEFADRVLEGASRPPCPTGENVLQNTFFC